MFTRRFPISFLILCFAFLSLTSVPFSLNAQEGPQAGVVIDPNRQAIIESLSKVYQQIDSVDVPESAAVAGLFHLDGDFNRRGISKSTMRLAAADLRSVAESFIQREAALLGLSNDLEDRIRLHQSATDTAENAHLLYRRYVADIRLDEADVRVHMRPDGSIFAVNGYLIRLSSDALQSIVDAARRQHLTQDEVKRVLAADLGQMLDGTTRLEKLCIPKPPFVIWTADVTTEAVIGRWKYWIDAFTGQIISKRDGLQRESGPRIGTGKGVLGDTKTHIDTYFEDGFLGFGQKYKLRDETRRANSNPHGHGGQMASNAVIETEKWGPNNSSVMEDPDNIWDAADQAAGVDAHVNAAKVYDYLLARGFNSFDRNGSTMRSRVWVADQANNAAWWDGGKVVLYGNNTDGGSWAAALDVVAHEWAHALTDSASNLEYMEESGALNEAFSDWVGVAVEHNYDIRNWTIGESIKTIRDLADPLKSRDPLQPDTYQGVNWFWKTDKTDCTIKATDYCGVHANSGVPNKMFYLLSQGGTHKYNVAVEPIGIETAIKVAMDANRLVWSANTNFLFGRAGMTAAAQVYGQNVVNQVRNAWAAVGVGPPANPVPATVTRPADGSTLPGSSVTFEWTLGTGVREYTLYVGYSPGTTEVFGQSAGLSISRSVSGIPTDGRAIYVRLFSQIGTTVHYRDYMFGAATVGVTPVAGTMTSPVNNSTLSGATVTFQWAGTAVLEYFLYVGNAVGTNDIYGGTQNLSTTRSVTGIPTDGRPIYVRLWSRIGITWQPRDYTYAAFSSVTAVPATMSSPANNTTFTGSSVTFQWTTGTAVLEYFLYVGNAVGTNDIYGGTQNLNTTKSVTGIPTDGRQIYVRLWSRVGSSWQPRDYLYAAALVGVTAVPAIITSPANNSTLTSSSVTFQWNAGTAVLEYFLYIGNAVGQNDILGQTQGLNTSKTVSGLPADGRILYVRLWSRIGSVWQPRDYTYTASGGSGCGTPISAAMTSPANNSTLSGSSATFQWNTGSCVLEFFLYIGNAVGQNDILGQTQGLNTSKIVSGLPVDGRILYVRLWSRIGSAWQLRDYTYRASGGSSALSDLVLTSLTAPTNGTAGGVLGGMQVIIRNQGSANAGPFRVGFYYSTNSNITASSIFSGTYCDITAGLTANNTFTCSGSVSIPASLPQGTYYFGAIVDDLNQVTESSESNNLRLADTGTIFVAAPCSAAFCNGDIVTVTNNGTGLNLRQCASTNSSNCPVIVLMPDGTQMLVLGGPVQADGYTWWNLGGNVNNIYRQGWAASIGLRK